MRLSLSVSATALLLALAAGPALADDAVVPGAPDAPVTTAPAIEESTTVEAVIVTAVRNPEDPRIVANTRERLSRTPGAVSVVANESFENRTAQGMSDLLRDVPGVLAQKRYGEESRLSIRGSGLSQGFHQRGVLLAQDGVSFADADGFSDFQGVDSQTARYIEVFRGGNALRFGGAQLGGAVNLVTPTGRTAESENLLRLEGGSFGTLRAQGSIARESGDWDVYANLGALVSDGWRQQSEQAQVRGTVNLGRSFGEDREVRLIVYAADVQQEVPGTLTLSQALKTPRMAPAVNVANDYARDLGLVRTTLQTRWRFSESLVFEGGVYATTKDLFHPIYQVIDQQSETQGLFGRFDWSGEVAGLKADLYAGLSYRQGELEALQFVNVGGRRGAQTSDAI
ncbi:MAG TPA: TonB-dependent receptor plug domain-containing protein, partial [Caulobacteraceae bacterium]|nr:TonB-dependent receptor plug domain-containing protein [Caulobacteraceae bacterium]